MMYVAMNNRPWSRALPVYEQVSAPNNKSLPVICFVERFSHTEGVIVQQTAVHHQLHCSVLERASALQYTKHLFIYVILKQLHTYPYV